MKLYNTLTRKVDEFTPVEPGKVRLYACGLTVYSQPHIGNWVAYIYWDVLVRTLRASGYKVTHVQNITDVGHLTSDEDAGEDKMLKGALQEGLSAWQVADKYIAVADKEAYELLELTRPNHMPRATDYIEQQADFVRQLAQKGYTYEIADGIYFDTSKLTDYGQLARLDIDGLQFGARVEDSGKKNPTDFAVWKFSDASEKRDMEWPSPTDDGRMGFPGWHLECSVMARQLLGDQIDIHTGGIDHIPVHHTNEIAQTEAITGQKFANFWIHANHIKVDGTKMSKSLGNIYTLQDIIDRGYDLRAFKLLVLSKHYRTEGNFTWEILEAAQNRLERWQAVADMRWQNQSDSSIKRGDVFEQELLQLLQNDLDTPGALAYIDQTLSATMDGDKDYAAHLESNLRYINELLGINLLLPDITGKQKAMIAEREAARQAKNWAESDRLRDRLKQQNIEISDTPNGPIWSRILKK